MSILIVFGLIVAMIGCIYPAYLSANAQVEGEYYALAFSTGIYKYRYQKGSIYRVSDLDINLDLYDVYWPTYESDAGILIFEAKSKSENGKTSIYSMAIHNENTKVLKIIDGRYPSLSSDGRILAYYKHPNELWTMNLRHNTSKKVASDMLKRQPVVWLPNNKILYASLSKEAIIVDSKNDQIKPTGIYDIIPSSISPSGAHVLCGSHDGKQIFLYSVDTKDLNLLKKTKFLTMGTSFVWLPNDEGFLFTRQTWSNVLRLNEATDLFLHKFKNDETDVMDNVVMYGGVQLGR